MNRIVWEDPDQGRTYLIQVSIESLEPHLIELSVELHESQAVFEFRGTIAPEYQAGLEAFGRILLFVVTEIRSGRFSRPKFDPQIHFLGTGEELPQVVGLSEAQTVIDVIRLFPWKSIELWWDGIRILI
jgi:hypothetical protein